MDLGGVRRKYRRNARIYDRLVRRPTARLRARAIRAARARDWRECRRSRVRHRPLPRRAPGRRRAQGRVVGIDAEPRHVDARPREIREGRLGQRHARRGRRGGGRARAGSLRRRPSASTPMTSCARGRRRAGRRRAATGWSRGRCRRQARRRCVGPFGELRDGGVLTDGDHESHGFRPPVDGSRGDRRRARDREPSLGYGSIWRGA